jgi:N-dimethylarginine dimethylaminohydrolase
MAQAVLLQPETLTKAIQAKKVLSIQEMADWLAELVINGKVDARYVHLDEVCAPTVFE